VNGRVTLTNYELTFRASDPPAVETHALMARCSGIAWPEVSPILWRIDAVHRDCYG
jgi:hypothetical protein